MLKLLLLVQLGMDEKTISAKTKIYTTCSQHDPGMSVSERKEFDLSAKGKVVLEASRIWNSHVLDETRL